MQLVKYKVNKFRSTKGTDWIETDQWTCFVGVNESGKTNLLLPLWKFNPADDATSIDLLHDYPRDEYSELGTEDDSRLSEPFIEVLFKLNEDEVSEITTRYQNHLQSLNETESESESSSESEGNQPSIKFEKFLLIKKDYNENFYFYVSNEECKEISQEISSHIGDDLYEYICEQIPRFVYYSEYGNLDSDLYLPRVKEDLARIDNLSGKERMKARTLRILFGHLKLNPEEILSLGQESKPNNDSKQKSQELIDKESRNKQERFAKVTSAASRLSTQFKNWWSQGDYTFQFNADGEYFRILVSDSERPSPIELESRSKGLQWFFSFFLVFLAESEDSHKNCILLLDEPGLSLHPNAQKDLISFFNQLAEKNQLIYTTHLPFLVDHNRLDRIKAVYTEKGLTKASNDLSKADKDKKAIQPVNAAIGITASESLLIGCDIVIVEGISDQYYLTMIKNYLISKGKFKPKREMVFIPVGGTKGIKPVVSIVQGSKSKLPFSLLDSDQTGKKFQKDLQNGLYQNEKNKVLDMDTFSGKQGSEIEDLIPQEILMDCFDRLFRLEDGFEEDAIDSQKPIIPQLEQFASDHNIELGKGWKVQLSDKVKRKFKGEISSDLETKWADLFEKLQ